MLGQDLDIQYYSLPQPPFSKSDPWRIGIYKAAIFAIRRDVWPAKYFVSGQISSSRYLQSGRIFYEIYAIRPDICRDICYPAGYLQRSVIRPDICLNIYYPAGYLARYLLSGQIFAEIYAMRPDICRHICYLLDICRDKCNAAG